MLTHSTDLHVIFGTGPLGTAVMRSLRRRGKRVRVINRTGRPSPALGDAGEIELMAADAYDKASTATAIAGATHVYQCAQPAYHRWAEQFPALQQTILEAASALGAKLIVAENLYMYGEPQGRPLTEDTPYRPNTRKGRVRAEMTDALFEAHARGQIRATAGRASDFYGPGDLLGERLFGAALQGKTANGLGNLDQPHTFSYIEDFGEALAVLGEREEALGHAWHIPSAEPLTQRDLIRQIFTEIGAPSKIGVYSPWMLKLVGMFTPAVREVNEMLYEFTAPFVMDSSRFQHQFGQQPTPHVEGVRRTVAWFRAHLAAARPERPR
ncbi:MAG TPA: NAD-dependent epimerase/dehydratase family protein [Anaerolineales bacterium]|nr:NAD-dependent epimerase/dehydratase family protein [Anaerolineales bacterium]